MNRAAPVLSGVGERVTCDVFTSPIDVCCWDDTIERVRAWAKRRESRYVCICNVHSVVTASQDPEFAAVLANADMATPDGAPVAWLMRRLGHRHQERINGPDLMWRYCKVAEMEQQPIFLYGNTNATLELLRNALLHEFPRLCIAGAYSPPYRALTESEEQDVVNLINSSGAATVWVSLGCPKQELWMARQRGRINAVMVGVGAAFDYHAGTIKRAPYWMQRNGLEWLHRLASEPRRLWRRYLKTNYLFVIRVVSTLLSGRPRY